MSIISNVNRPALSEEPLLSASLDNERPVVAGESSNEEEVGAVLEISRGIPRSPDENGPRGPVQVVFKQRLCRKVEVEEGELQEIGDIFSKMKELLHLTGVRDRPAILASYSLDSRTITVEGKPYDMRVEASIEQLLKDVNIDYRGEELENIRTKFEEYHSELDERLRKFQVRKPICFDRRRSLLEDSNFTKEVVFWNIPVSSLKIWKLVKEDSGDEGILTEEGKNVCRRMGALRAFHACLLAQQKHHLGEIAQSRSTLLSSSPEGREARELLEDRLRELEDAEGKMAKIVEQLKSPTFMHQVDFLLFVAHAQQGENQSLVQFLSSSVAGGDSNRLESREGIEALGQCGVFGAFLGQCALAGREKRGGISEGFRTQPIPATAEELETVALLSNRIFDVVDASLSPYAVETVRKDCLEESHSGSAVSYVQSDQLLGCVLLELLASDSNQRACDGFIGKALERFRTVRDEVGNLIEGQIRGEFPLKKVSKIFGDKTLLKNIAQLVENSRETAVGA